MIYLRIFNLIKKYMDNINDLDLKTGDIILFSSENNGWLSYFSSIIKYGSHSNYTHIGMILKDPTFISPLLKGIYVWESGYEGTPDPQDGKIKLGVQITPISVIMNNFKDSKIFIRKIKADKKKFNNYILKNIHKAVYDKSYDLNLNNWINGFFQKSNKPHSDCFWCSALVGYIYTKCSILKDNTNWSILRPNDFSLDGENLDFTKNCFLEFKEYRIN